MANLTSTTLPSVPQEPKQSSILNRAIEGPGVFAKLGGHSFTFFADFCKIGHFAVPLSQGIATLCCFYTHRNTAHDLFCVLILKYILLERLFMIEIVPQTAMFHCQF